MVASWCRYNGMWMLRVPVEEAVQGQNVQVCDDQGNVTVKRIKFIRSGPLRFGHVRVVYAMYGPPLPADPIPHRISSHGDWVLLRERVRDWYNAAEQLQMWRRRGFDGGGVECVEWEEEVAKKREGVKAVLARMGAGDSSQGVVETLVSDYVYDSGAYMEVNSVLFRRGLWFVWFRCW